MLQLREASLSPTLPQPNAHHEDEKRTPVMAFLFDPCSMRWDNTVILKLLSSASRPAENPRSAHDPIRRRAHKLVEWRLLSSEGCRDSATTDECTGPGMANN